MPAKCGHKDSVFFPGYRYRLCQECYDADYRKWWEAVMPS